VRVLFPSYKCNQLSKIQPTSSTGPLFINSDLQGTTTAYHNPTVNGNFSLRSCSRDEDEQYGSR
jgi:hypothetical protein